MKTPKKRTGWDPKNTRRGFLGWVWMILGGVVLMEFLFFCLSFLFPGQSKDKETQAPKIVDAGLVSSFEPGSVTPFVRGQFYLVHFKTGGFLALSSRCTHLGCSLPWDEKTQSFICPCHASKFDIKGQVLSPPAPRAMDLFSLEIKKERLFVDISKKIRRKGFVKDQVTYPQTINRSSKAS